MAYVGPDTGQWVCDSICPGAGLLYIDFLGFAVQSIGQKADGDALGYIGASICLEQETEERVQRDCFHPIVGMEGSKALVELNVKLNRAALYCGRRCDNVTRRLYIRYLMTMLKVFSMFVTGVRPVQWGPDRPVSGMMQ